MTKEQLFKKYKITADKYSDWTADDRFFLIELRLFMTGDLSGSGTIFILDFLDKAAADIRFSITAKTRNAEFGNLFLTAKRAVFLLYEQILQEINGQKSN